jgi:hypothetical protein
MSSTKTAPAWPPFTPRGVARFAHASLKRLWAVQIVFAVLVAATVIWFFHTAWFPTITAAIRKLPARGEVRLGKLDWTDDAQLLADGRFLAIAVDPAHTGQIRSPAHVQVEFGRSDVLFISLLGYSHCGYPDRRWVMAFNRTELEPWWGAWRPPILWITFGIVAISLPIFWAVLATLGAGPVWLVGLFANRELKFWQSWKMAGAAWLPGTALLIAAVLFHGFGFIDLVQLLGAWVLYLVVGALFAMTGPLFVPKLSSPAKRNPFSRS